MTWKPVAVSTLFSSQPLAPKLVMIGLWLGLAAASVLGGVAVVAFNLNGIPLTLGPIHLFVTVYPPLLLCTLALFWAGFGWAFGAAYLATVASALVAGMPLGWALLFGLADPLALAVYALAYRAAPVRYDLRSLPSMAFFLTVSLVGAIAGSTGSFIWSLTRSLTAAETFAIWQGWWLGAFLQAALIVAPLLAALSPAVERVKAHSLGLPTRNHPPVTLAWVTASILAGCLILIGFVWANGRLAGARLAATLDGSIPTATREAVLAAAKGWDLVTWHGVVLIAAAAIGGAFLAASWSRVLERVVRTRTAELSEARNRYALAARGANDGLWDWNLDSGVITFSPRWQSMLGLAEDEAGSEPEEWFGRVHPDDRDRVLMELDAHLTGGAAHFQSEHRIRHTDGSWRFVLSRGLAVRDTAGRAIRMAGSQSDITERKEAETQLLHDAFHDGLTGLPNRALFMDRLAGAISRLGRHDHAVAAVLLIDVDRFSVFNDSLGHQAGDELLAAIALRIAGCLGPGDTLARVGGDDFAVLFEDLAGEHEATRKAAHIQEELAQPLAIAGQEVFITASIGVAFASSPHARREDLLRDADTASHRRAAAQAGGRVQVFNPGMHASAVERLRIESDLRRALEREEFEIHYQPIVALDSSRLVGFEALLRWRHGGRGLIPLEEFIGVAEETGLMLPLGRWVLKHACQQLAVWSEGVPGAERLTLAVNLSSRQLVDPALLDDVRSILTSTHLAPGQLSLEITESAIIENQDSAATVLRQLRGLSVGIHVDDFGTGYSSLSYLHRFPVDVLKIDRSFTSKLSRAHGDHEIVRTIITLAGSLRLRVIAEGVETSEQATILRELACDYGQGYWFSHPLPALAARELINQPPHWATQTATPANLI